MELEAIQAALRDAGHDGWLFYDHHHRDPIAAHILGLDEKAHITRRWYYFVPAEGEPRKLVHRIEQGRLDSLPGTKGLYSSWQELAGGLEAMLMGATEIAMQYSPNNAIMYVSMVDAGTVEFLRGLGKQIVSSADLVSQFEAVLSEEQMTTHTIARRGDRPDPGRRMERNWQAIASAVGFSPDCRIDRVRSRAVAEQSHAAGRTGLGERSQCERQRQQLRLTL